MNRRENSWTNRSPGVGGLRKCHAERDGALHLLVYLSEHGAAEMCRCAAVFALSIVFEASGRVQTQELTEKVYESTRKKAREKLVFGYAQLVFEEAEFGIEAMLVVIDFDAIFQEEFGLFGGGAQFGLLVEVG